VILACPEAGLGAAEHKRLSGLYGSSQISVSVVEGSNLRTLESLLLRALDTHGGVTNIVNSTTDNKLNVNRLELAGPLDSVEKYLNLKQQQHEVKAIRDINKLAVKYLGKHNGFNGGSVINLVSRTELLKLSNRQMSEAASAKPISHSCTKLSVEERLGSDSIPPGSTQPPSNPSQFASQLSRTTGQLPEAPPLRSCFLPDEPLTKCTVLGTTRALGLSKHMAKHGVKTSTVYEPIIDYPELSAASQITDDEHSPYYTWNRYSAYCREYTGYMALHIADTAPSGTAWRFNSELRLETVDPTMIPSTCKLANKMCYWLGCPHVEQLPHQQQQRGASDQQLRNGTAAPDSVEQESTKEYQDN